MKTSILAATLVLSACIAVHAQQSKPGMTMPSAPQPQPARPTVKAHPSDGDTRTQDMPAMHSDAPAMQAPARGAITWDILNLQEPEDPTHKTGSNMPAPDLLKDISTHRAMTLEDFLTLADRLNPTLAQAHALERKSDALAQQAGLYPNPSAGYQGEQIRGGSYGGGEQGGFVQQTIVLGGKLGLRREIYTQQGRSDRIGIEEQTYRVHNDVTQAFYSALTAQAMVVVRQRLVGVALDAVETVHQLANVGQADAPDILQTEVEAEQAKIDFVTAQRNFLEKFRTLTALTGDPSTPVSPLTGTLETPPDLDADHQVADLIDASPAVKRMKQDVAVREARLRAARREPVPDLQLRAGEEYNFEHLSGTLSTATGPQTFASASIDLPLWNRNQGNIAAANAEIARARLEVTRTQLALRQRAEPLAQSYQTARFTADRYRTELIPRAQRAYELYLAKYKSMAMAYPQVLVSQRTLFQLQIGYLSALHDQWAAAIALENYTLSGGLAAPESTGSSSTSLNPPDSSASSLE